eukprot:CAMPEP_0197173058 /NCGR_PEP_ID=MMETSP1423-20130617/115_1 /TAXON_ID=476441 /ORGANISM="Pseudo-nitzschia heimii, Strain UNC1101" /LENGTH=200 /DNA_ID=CAMNT_0042621809 /DNA_START=145 /DNA_END=747 /DNA_ORIENTATION=+
MSKAPEPGGSTPLSNDGGIVLSIFLMVAALTYAMYSAISVYAHHRPSGKAAATPNESSVESLVRIFSAWANIGNCVVHVLLVVYIMANEGSEAAYWVRERELEADGIEGPLGLAILNFAAGMCSMHGKAMAFPLVWNSFVVIAGTLLPVVWLRFLEEGLATWPYFILFVWFAIFAMELTAFTTSWTYRGIRTTAASKKDD